MGTTTIIASVDEITPEWLGSILGDGDGDAAPITAVTCEPLGTGQMCDSYRVRYERADGSSGRLIAKLPSADEGSRAAGLMMRAYEKEVRFYQELAPSLPVTTPVMHHADIDVATGAFTLLLEDLSPAEQGDQLAGCTIEQARDVIPELVDLHAPRWGDETLLALDWLAGDPATARAMMTQLLPMLWAGFTDRYGDVVEDHVVDTGTVLFDRLAVYLDPPGPLTVTHGDFRVDNLLFHPGGGRVAVVDWQTCTVGPGPGDVAYFIGAGLLADDRRRHEDELVRDYHRRLVDAGVRANWDEVWTQYRWSTFGGLVVAVAASMLVERTERGDAMFMAMASRHAQHAIDHTAAELLER